MSIKAENAVAGLAPKMVTPRERLVLYVLARRSNPKHDDNAWPAVATLVAETSLSRRGVQTILHALVVKRFVTITGTGPRGVIRYRMNLEYLFKCARGTITESAPDYAATAQTSARDRAATAQSSSSDYAATAQSTGRLVHMDRAVTAQSKRKTAALHRAATAQSRRRAKV